MVTCKVVETIDDAMKIRILREFTSSFFSLNIVAILSILHKSVAIISATLFLYKNIKLGLQVNIAATLFFVVTLIIIYLLCYKLDNYLDARLVIG